MSIVTQAAHSVGRAFKAGAKAAAGAVGIVFSGWGGGSGLGRWSWGGSYLRGTAVDYAAQVGDGRGNAIVVACMEAFVTAFSEAPIRVQRISGKNLTPVLDHPMVQLMARPNPYYSGVLLLKAFVSDWLLGNAYLLKVRSKGRRVVELYWIPSSMMEPRWDASGNQYIGWYDYHVDGRVVRYETSDVVHLRNGFDPQNMRKGLSRLATLVREIATDDEAANFSASLLRNLGVPGVILAPSGDMDVSQEDADLAKLEFTQKFSGDNRGAPLVMRAPTAVTVLGFNPQQMNMKDMRRVPEERISAAVGVPAIVAGLGAGLDRSTYSNMEEAREMFYETSIVPAYRLFAAELHTQLMADFENVDTVVVDFDISKVRVLQADEDALHKRARDDVSAGIITLNEGREMIGKDQMNGADVLLIPAHVIPTDAANLLDAIPITTPKPVVLPAEAQGAADTTLAGVGGPASTAPKNGTANGTAA